MARRTFTIGVLAVGLVAVLFGAAAALADWDVGDPYKMHYPQLPKVNGGWDVKSSYYLFLADDFLCTETGYVNDIHTWVSFKNDAVFDPATVHLAIWSDDPVGNQYIPGEDPNNTFSKPLAQLWHGDKTMHDWTMRYWGTGTQGWFDPRDPNGRVLNDHEGVYQLNFVFDDQHAFYQQQGNIYWLEFTIQQPVEVNIGWKESGSEHYNDDACWRILGEPWNELRNPITYESMDLAFVITPEPSCLVLLVTMLAGLLAVRRRS